jgi:hypothetical protein
MAATIADFISENIIVIIIAIVALITAVIFLIVERVLHRGIVKTKEEKEEEQKFKEEIEKIRRIKSEKKTAKEKLNNLTFASKEFFDKNFNISKNLGFSEIIENLRKQKRERYIPFCQAMLKEYYLDQTIENDRVNQLIDSFAFIVKKDGNIEDGKEIYPRIKKLEKPGIKKSNYLENYIRDFLKESSNVHRIETRIHSNKHTMELSRKHVAEHETKRFLMDNPLVLDEMKKLNEALKQTHSTFTRLFNEVYHLGNKKELRKMAEAWKNEKHRLHSIIKNPLRQHMLEIALFDKYYRKLKEIMNKK